MAIRISANIRPVNDGPGIFTHEDIFGKGGFIALDTAGPSGTIQNKLNTLVPAARRKSGMLVYDVDTAAYYRLDGSDWVEENFGQSDALAGIEAGPGISTEVLSDGRVKISAELNAGKGIDISENTDNVLEIALNASIFDLNDVESGTAGSPLTFLNFDNDKVSPASLTNLLNLGDLVNVNGTTPTDGQALVWYAEQQEWGPGGFPGGEGPPTLAAQFLLWGTDEVPSYLTGARVLSVGSGLFGGENTEGVYEIYLNASINDLFDVVIDSGNLAEDQYLGWNGNEWVNKEFPTFAQSLGDLLDVSASVSSTDVVKGSVLVKGDSEWEHQEYVWGGSATL